MAVALDAVMTAGNQVDTEAAANTTSVSSTGITVGAGATLLIVAMAWQGTNGPTARSATWNGVAMTEAAFVRNGTDGAGVNASALYVIVNPAAGANTISVSWTNANDVYVGAISFSGTDTSTGINATDTTTATANSVNVTGSTDGATVATSCNNSNEPTTSQTKFWGYAALNPGGGGSYEVGTGGTVTHTFTYSAGTRPTVAAVHVIAGGAAAPKFRRSRLGTRTGVRQAA